MLNFCAFIMRFFKFAILGLILLEGANLTHASAQEILPNEIGNIPVIEYHRIMPEEGSYARSIKNFKKDLEFFYNNDYRLMRLSDFLKQNIAIEYNKKPLLMVFDDSDITQFKYLEDGSIDPNCAIGILDDFYEKHPDFGRSATFFVLPALFGQPDYEKQKLEYLLETGREIGNHTISHPALAKLSPEEIEAELGGLIEIANSYLDEPLTINAVAYPYGSVPKSDEQMAALTSGVYKGASYKNKIGFLVGADPAYPPYHNKYDPFYVPRIQAIDSEFKRWFNREPGSTAKISENFLAFRSDADPNILSVKERFADRIDETKLRAWMTICYSDSPNTDPGCEEEIEEIEEMEETEETETSRPRYLKEALVRGAVTLAEVGGVFVSDEHVLAAKTAEFFPNLKFNSVPSELYLDKRKWHYEVQAGDNLTSVVEKLLSHTSFYLGQSLREAINETNDYSDEDFKEGFLLQIPEIELFSFDFRPEIESKKGIYWTGYTAGNMSGYYQALKLKSEGGNTVIFDVKEVEGRLFYDSKLPLAQEMGAIKIMVDDPRKMIRYLHKNGFYVVARMTVFKDMLLAQHRPQWAPKDKISGEPWENREGVVWMDPSSADVQDYNLAIAQEVAQLGIDEVQFDYIRFPALGLTENAVYAFLDSPNLTKMDVINRFVKKAYHRLAPTGVKIGVDVFGVVAWNDGYDAVIVGQDIPTMAKYADAIYPMIYPSHFSSGFAGKANPGGEPYFFVYKSTEKFLQLVEGKKAVIRPWIQGFAWGATGFGPNYVNAQVQALSDIGVHEFAIWNAANKYDVSWGAF